VPRKIPKQELEELVLDAAEEQALDEAAARPLSKAAEKMRLLKSLKCTTKLEKAAWNSGATLVAGVDEVGRGCLFGPVVAGACILLPDYRIRGLRDSKLLTEADREALAERIQQHCVAWAVAAVDVATIDQINIYHASKLAMVEALRLLIPSPDYLLVDGNARIDWECTQQTVVHGDALSASIAAASILAKVYRDQLMREWDPVYPMYGLASNKGYSAPKHLESLREFGPSPLHRQSFAPVWNARVVQTVMEFSEAAAIDEEC
jgi:ribonuclease HII